jgi:DNA-binding LacI/PurR family transcriptional regulator
MGLAIPSTFGVTGLGNHAVALSISPALATVDFNYELMGQHAVRALVEQGQQVAPIRESVSGTMIVRGSL